MEKVLSVSETARRLDISSETVRKWADTGKLPAMRTDSGQRIFHRADVERVRQERRAGHGDEA